MHESPKLEVGRKTKNNLQSTPHESAQLHVTGEAQYTDDVPAPGNTLHAYVGLSTNTHALIMDLNLDKVRSAPGVVCVVDAADIPGLSDICLLYTSDAADE